MLNPLVFLALVALIRAIADAYFSNFPLSDELINTLLVALLALFGVEVGVAGVRKFYPAAIRNGLVKDSE